MGLAEIRLQEGESLENALRRFKRKVQTEDIIKEVKRHSYYLKPGERRRVKQALAQKRARKKLRKEHDKFQQFGPLLPSGGLRELTANWRSAQNGTVSSNRRS
jgi:small subunit ribosomal protein S21